MIPNLIVQDFIEVLSPDIEVIKHNQPGKRLKYPYCTWQEISNPASGREQITYSTIDSVYTESVNINKTEAIQVEFYTATASQSKSKKITGYRSAYDYAEEMIARLNTFSSQAYQKTNNIGVMSWTDLTPLTKFMGDNNELRATIELFINNNLNYSEKTYSTNVDSVTTNLTLEGI